MARPLMQHGVGQLEEMFAKAKSDPKALKQLEHELQYRQVPRAVALLAEVQAAMYGGTPAAPSVAVPAQPLATASPPLPQQPSLWERPPAAPVAVALPVAQPRPSASAVRPPEVPAVAKPSSPPAPNMPLEEAYKVLKTTPGATWESIEQTRRMLVQQSHPSRLKSLGAERSAQTLSEARRVNAAYAALARQRTDGA